ncbi:MAG TPA: arylsulfatase [Pirellulales bacterium]|nr:arylsulfatase [Pirellulales bacterium]
MSRYCALAERRLQRINAQTGETVVCLAILKRLKLSRHSLHRITTLIIVELSVSLSICHVFADNLAEKQCRPNIVVILADDYGWGSVGCYGGLGLKTPNLDRLAREGRRFTDAYAPGSVCSPTRYGLMTGRYYWRTSIKDGEVLSGSAPLHIETDRLTLGSLCKSAGYRTGAFGKWHLGLGNETTTDWSLPLKPGPLEIGFDYFFGLAANPWNGPHSFIENYEVLGKLPGQPVLIKGNKADAATSGIERPWQEDHIMGTLTDHVVRWINENKDGPFFVYYAPNAIHEPVIPNDSFSGSPLGKYGDFISELDWSVGEILNALDRMKLADETLIIFSSDNGGVCNRNNPNAAAAMDAGLAINGNLRGGKHDEWEGGFREPFLVRWPKRVPAGTVSNQVICLTDILATLAGVLGLPLSENQAEDSFDVLRAFTEATAGPPVRGPVIMQSADGIYGVRSGDWKFIERVDAPPIEHRNRRKAQMAERKKKSAPRTDELFNLTTDSSEAVSVVADHVEIAAKLKQALIAARDANHTRPME